MISLKDLKPLQKGLIVAALHVALVCSLGGKMLYDRATCTRVWALTAPYDPYDPIRGRYVRMMLTGDAVTQDMAPAPQVPKDVVEYFIPEHALDPSLRNRGEELWVEVTIPKKGPPRPIRLGVKKNGMIAPLEI